MGSTKKLLLTKLYYIEHILHINNTITTYLQFSRKKKKYEYLMNYTIFPHFTVTIFFFVIYKFIN